MTTRTALSAAVSAIRNGKHIPASAAAVLESRGIDLAELTERHLNS